MALRTMHEKGTDADLLREMIGFATERLMELEVQGLTGAAHGERSAERLAQHPDTLVLHTGNRKGVQTAAHQWALEHGVPCVIQAPRWQERGKATGFERNAAMVRAAQKGCGHMILVANREDSGSRHLAAAGLKEGIRAWCIAERRLLGTDDIAFRPAPTSSDPNRPRRPAAGASLPCRRTRLG